MPLGTQLDRRRKQRDYRLLAFFVSIGQLLEEVFLCLLFVIGDWLRVTLNAFQQWLEATFQLVKLWKLQVIEFRFTNRSISRVRTHNSSRVNISSNWISGVYISSNILESGVHISSSVNRFGFRVSHFLQTISFRVPNFLHKKKLILCWSEI